jgi:release factor glutamine methyltransferase
MDLGHGWRPRRFDFIIFNPPYVVTPDDEVFRGRAGQDVVQATYAGGTDGRIVIDAFLAHLPVT